MLIKATYIMHTFNYKVISVIKHNINVSYTVMKEEWGIWG